MTSQVYKVMFYNIVPLKNFLLKPTNSEKKGGNIQIKIRPSDLNGGPYILIWQIP
jgi:hypothetical protein